MAPVGWSMASAFGVALGGVDGAADGAGLDDGPDDAPALVQATADRAKALSATTVRDREVALRRGWFDMGARRQNREHGSSRDRLKLEDWDQ